MLDYAYNNMEGEVLDLYSICVFVKISLSKLICILYSVIIFVK